MWEILLDSTQTYFSMSSKNIHLYQDNYRILDIWKQTNILLKYVLLFIQKFETF